MKIKQERLREIIREEISKVHHNTSLMEDMFTEEEKQALTEMASFSTAKDKIENQMIPFVMISAFRGGLSGKENLKRQKELEASVASAGFPWSKMPGSGYVEDPEEEGGEPSEVKENSILIWDEVRPDKPRIGTSLFDLGQRLAHEYDQDSFIFGSPVEEDGKAKMKIKVFDKGGSEIEEVWAGPWSTVKLALNSDLYWSTVAGKRAKLVEMKESYRKSKAGSFMGAVKKQYYLEAIDSALKWIDNKEQK